MAAGGSVPKSAFEQNFDPEFMFNLYFRLDCPFAEDTVAKGLKALEEAFTTYAVKGDLLIGINNNPTVHQYISASKYFKEIIATNYSKRCLQQLVKWLKNDPGAYDYSHIFKYACKLEDDSLQPGLAQRDIVATTRKTGPLTGPKVCWRRSRPHR
ncbi:indolethylamine N-methyltransferase-like isoform X2 [Lissotriton helveticus]